MFCFVQFCSFLFCSVCLFFGFFFLFEGGRLLYLYGITIFYISRDQWSIIMRSKYRHFSESCFHLPEMGTRICWTHLLDIWKGWYQRSGQSLYVCIKEWGCYQFLKTSTLSFLYRKHLPVGKHIAPKFWVLLGRICPRSTRNKKEWKSILCKKKKCYIKPALPPPTTPMIIKWSSSSLYVHSLITIYRVSLNNCCVKGLINISKIIQVGMYIGQYEKIKL